MKIRRNYLNISAIMHDICLEVLTVHSNGLRLFVAKVILLLELSMSVGTTFNVFILKLFLPSIRY